MPEYIEISYIVELVQKCIGMTVFQVQSLGQPCKFFLKRIYLFFLDKKEQKNNEREELLKSIQLPFTIQEIKQRGKEISIITNKSSFLIQSLGQGKIIDNIFYL
jgi:hypothetical protein